MQDTIMKSSRLRFRPAAEQDLDFIIDAENDAENRNFISQWPREQHYSKMNEKDSLHLVIEEISSGESIGYIIINGLDSPSRSIELKRLVITKKESGYGREALKQINQWAFTEQKAHRLWLDVLSNNPRAKYLYESEGFVVEGTQRECVLKNGEYLSLMMMSILENEYKGL
ncbi:GNAT family protein [Paenibacillus sediminis]|uniref:RimJ/RimL family protein N-acetyltransferase n=1 Tax=Paenibacillus sediminis TaxID=664909 RepID=A0ABS4H1X1_9BACL|nr:GNAT family protein [Paenibacillus sediminis]MBP1936526.1 RimJ/RimL family protein N-acetyltransferase [Paenibacillus sediminis]